MGQLTTPLDKLDLEIALLEQKRKLLKYAGADRIISSHEKYEILKKSESEDVLNFKIFSKISLLDSMTDGFRLGTVNIVSGPTGEGKTTWMQTLTKNFSTQNINSVWFSFEVMPSEFFAKFGGDIPLFYLPKEIPEQSSITWIRERAIEAQAKFNAKVVFIDHLHYLSEMQGLSTTEKTSLLIGDLLRKLKRLSIELEIAIFLIVHVKSDSGNQAQLKKYYTKDDIRDSSFVKQEADTVMMIWRKRKKVSSEIGWEYTERAILNFDKHRRTGKVGFVNLSHYNQMFIEFDAYIPEQEFNVTELFNEQDVEDAIQTKLKEDAKKQGEIFNQ